MIRKKGNVGAALKRDGIVSIALSGDDVSKLAVFGDIHVVLQNIHGLDRQ